MKKILFTVISLYSLNAISQLQSLDATFGTGGKVITSVNAGADKAYGVFVQPDGKIVVAGTTTSTATGKDFACVRYNSDGTPDTSFATNGIYTNDIQTGSDDVAYSLVLQEDGKIVLAGYTDDGTNKNAAIIRLNSDGSIDTDFGTEGKVISEFITGSADEIKAVKIHNLTGNIIVGGTSASTSTASKGIIARYTSAGILDTAFNTTGIVVLPNATGNGIYYNIIEDVAIKANGKISAVGWINQQGLQWSSNYYACRLNSDGTLDTGFSADGVITLNGGFNGEDKAFSMILNSDDSILYSGGSYLEDLQYDYVLGYINPTGSTAQGQASFDYGVLKKDIAYAMATDSNGKIILAGSSVTSDTNSVFGIARINPNYSVDTTFGTSGKLTTTFGSNSKNEAFAVAVQNDNKIIAVGYTGNDFAMARYNATPVLSVAANYKEITAVYPNPAKDILNFTIAQNAESGDYSIIDINGRIVLKGKSDIGTNSVNIHSLSKGIYILKANNSFVKFIKE